MNSHVGPKLWFGAPENKLMAPNAMTEREFGSLESSRRAVRHREAEASKTNRARCLRYLFSVFLICKNARLSRCGKNPFISQNT
jgi:hypothetical protein